MEKIWIDAVEFESYGEWKTETQFVREMGQPYLIANHLPGTPVCDAFTSFSAGEDGYYRVFVRTKNWKIPQSPGQFKVSVDGTELNNICGKMPNPSWYWEIAGDVYLKSGKHTLNLCDKTGWLSRCSAVIITNDFDFTPSPEKNMLLKQRAMIKGICNEPKHMGEWDFVVVGAGPGGIPAAISAARNGLKTALICDRPHIGGNASLEGTIGFDGAGAKNPGYHETGIANEIKRVYEKNKITFQEALEKLVAGQPLITVFTNTFCSDAYTENGNIKYIEATNTLTLEKYIFKSDMYADCSGDGWLGYYAGADYRIGREAKHEYKEDFAPESPDTLTMSGCNCMTYKGKNIRGFYMERQEESVDFTAPDWATEIPDGTEEGRIQKKDFSPEWWLENSNDFDDLWEEEYARDALVCLGIGYFDWLKNKSPQKEEFKNHTLKGISLHNSKRENRRIIGDYVLNMTDIVNGEKFDDAVSYHGWGIDVHHPKGIFSGKEGPFYLNKKISVLPVPYRCLYSKNINNLFVASRCSSVSHLALGSTRVENTIATLGQAVGTAAALCKKYSTSPRGIYEKYIRELQQHLLKDDQTIPGIINEDKNDIARYAEITATSEDVSRNGYAKNIINGKIRSFEKECNAWISNKGLPQSISLKLNETADVSMVQITTETDLTYPYFSYHDVPSFGYTAQDLTIEIYNKGRCMEKREIKDNYMRQMRTYFDGVKADEIKITVNKTSGEDVAVINEIRIY